MKLSGIDFKPVPIHRTWAVYLTRTYPVLSIFCFFFVGKAWVFFKRIDFCRFRFSKYIYLYIQTRNNCNNAQYISRDLFTFTYRHETHYRSFCGWFFPIRFPHLNVERPGGLQREVTSRIFLHFLSELDMAREEIEKLLTESISSHAGHRSSEMIKLCIDQIEVGMMTDDWGVQRINCGSTVDGCDILQLADGKRLKIPWWSNDLPWLIEIPTDTLPGAGFRNHPQ